MASFLFTCVSCLGLRRLSGRTDAPPDFDSVCEECRAAKKEAIVAEKSLKERKEKGFTKPSVVYGKPVPITKPEESEAKKK